MFFPFIVFFIIVSTLCSIPLVIAIIYLIAGIKSFLIGRREKNKNKLIGGMNAVFYSILAMLLCYFLWYWLCKSLL